MQNLPIELKKEILNTLKVFEDSLKKYFSKKIIKQYEGLKIDPFVGSHLKNLGKLTKSERVDLARIFSIKMELINRIENAYRHYRISIKKHETYKSSPYATIYVFTAHPTEARSSATLFYFEKVEKLYQEKFKGQITDQQFENEFLNLISHIINNRLSKSKAPSVKDEASMLCDIVLNKNILQMQSQFKTQGNNVQFRTWVGGDKDGHPYVNEKTMRDTFHISRHYILSFIESILEDEKTFWELDSNSARNVIYKKLTALQELLRSLKVIKEGDGKRVTKFRQSFSKLIEEIQEHNLTLGKNLLTLKNIIWLYPALVLPLELREDAALVEQALKTNKGVILNMLKYLKSISKGLNAKWYVRGMVLSMTESSEDYQAGIKLVKKVFSNHMAIPVVPLFETRKALEEGIAILEQTFKEQSWLIDHYKKEWEGRYEIMMGYSDSSKESGVIASRSLIANVLNTYDKFFQAKKLTPVFFHGSGGSVERGGGSLSEQTSWWPKSALNIYKSTVQGEMITRNFSDSLIMGSTTRKIHENFDKRVVTKEKAGDWNFIQKFSMKVASEYESLVKDPLFADLVIGASPYSYLDQLKIGSRPSSRSKNKKEFKLRAIPWVLCWTQTRILMPTWWGIGSTFSNLSSEDKIKLLKIYRRSPFLQTFINVLGFSLKKIERKVFNVYLDNMLSKDDAKLWKTKFSDELDKTKEFYQFLTGKDDFLWFRPWLGESIELRSPLISPLNILQVYALKTSEIDLLRETVTGISCGMLTTG